MPDTCMWGLLAERKVIQRPARGTSRLRLLCFTYQCRIKCALLPQRPPAQQARKAHRFLIVGPPRAARETVSCSLFQRREAARRGGRASAWQVHVLRVPGRAAPSGREFGRSGPGRATSCQSPGKPSPRPRYPHVSLRGAQLGTSKVPNSFAISYPLLFSAIAESCDRTRAP